MAKTKEDDTFIEDAPSVEDQNEQMIPSSKVEATIKSRVKNLVEKNQLLEQQLAQTQAQGAPLPMQQPPIAPPVGAIPPQAPAPAQNVVAPGGLTQQDLQNAMAQQHQGVRETQASQNIQQMGQSDPEFGKLVNDANGQFKIPYRAWTGIGNDLDKETGKKLLTRLLTSKTDNDYVRLAAEKADLTGDATDYNNWLKDVLNQPRNDTDKAPQSAPDLSSVDKGTDGVNSDAVSNAIEDFGKNG